MQVDSVLRMDHPTSATEMMDAKFLSESQQVVSATSGMREHGSSVAFGSGRVVFVDEEPDTYNVAGKLRDRPLSGTNSALE